MAVAYLDTQIATWLHYGNLRKISREAARLIESRDLLISPMVYLEFDYMLRVGRVEHSADLIYSNLNANFGVSLCGIPFATVTSLAVENGWTSDPFDKIIAAQARANHNAPLITADSIICQHYAQAVW